MPVKRPPTPEYGKDQNAYNGLIDVADVHCWATFLGVDAQGWWIEVRDNPNGGLLARSASWVLADAAESCGASLVKQGRLR